MQAAAGAFLEAGRGGRIVNIASDLGVQACANLGGYAASKFAVVGLTQAAAIELAAARHHRQRRLPGHGRDRHGPRRTGQRSAPERLH